MAFRKRFPMTAPLLAAGNGLIALFLLSAPAFGAKTVDQRKVRQGNGAFDEPTDSRSLSDAARNNLRNLRKLEHQLDLVEIDFWSALVSDPARDFHKKMRQQLFDLTVLARSIHSVEGGTGEADPVPNALLLQKIFSSISPTQLNGRRPSFLKTSMREYRSAHQQHWRERRTDQEYASGKRSRQTRIPSPTLVTVDVEHYSLWVTDRISANRRRSPSAVGGKNQTLRSTTDDYCDAIGRFRVALVRMAEKYRNKDNEETSDRD